MAPQFQLVRKGTELRDPQRELRVEIDPPNPGILPRRFARQKFVVPKEDFLCPIDMDGKPIRIRLLKTDKVDVYPEFRLTGVADGDGGIRLASALYHGYDEQIPTLRELLDGIFRNFLGFNPTADQLEKVASRDNPNYELLKECVVEKLGLHAEWSLQPEPKTAQWLRALVQISPQSTVVIYNEELPSTKFKLAFSLAVERASISNLERLQHRAEQGLPPAQEFAHIFHRVRKISDPAFRSPWIGLNVWNQDLVRALAVDGFGKVVADRLEKELGYVVRFSDFVPEPSEDMISKMGHVSSRELLQEDYDRAKAVLQSLKEHRHQQLILSRGDYNRVKDLDVTIEQADAKLAEARNRLLSGNRQDLDALQTIEPTLLEDLRRKFRAALMLEEKTNSEERYGGPA